jgi:hypothetical protein
MLFYKSSEVRFTKFVETPTDTLTWEQVIA